MHPIDSRTRDARAPVLLLRVAMRKLRRAMQCVRAFVCACCRACVLSSVLACVRAFVRVCFRACCRACVLSCFRACLRACVPLSVLACVHAFVRACFHACCCVLSCRVWMRACCRACDARHTHKSTHARRHESKHARQHVKSAVFATLGDGGPARASVADTKAMTQNRRVGALYRRRRKQRDRRPDVAESRRESST